MRRAAWSSSRSYSAQVFEQQNHLVFLVGVAYSGAVPSRLLKARDSFGEFRAIARTMHRRIQNTGAQELGNELKFVGRQTGQEAAELHFPRANGTPHKGG